jgi:hypothetical protein
MGPRGLEKLRYCYVIHGADGSVFEKDCGFKRLEDAVRAVRKRAEELVMSGFYCTSTDGGLYGTEVYLCEGTMKFSPETLPREVELVLRVDVKVGEKKDEDEMETPECEKKTRRARKPRDEEGDQTPLLPVLPFFS